MYLREGLLEETQTIVICELMTFELYMLMDFLYYTLKLCADYEIVQLRILNNIKGINIIEQLK